MVVVTPSGPYQSSVQCGQTGRRVIWPSEERGDGVTEELEEQRSGGVVAAEEVALAASLAGGRGESGERRVEVPASEAGRRREDRHPHPPYNLWKGAAGDCGGGGVGLPPPVASLHLSSYSTCLIPPPVRFLQMFPPSTCTLPPPG